MEGKMACDEVFSLVEELHHLLHIPLKILNIKKLQARLFIEKIDEVLKILEMEGTPILQDQLVEGIVPLALPIGGFVQGPRLRLVRSCAEYIMTTQYGWGGKLTREVPEIVEQVGLIEDKLEKFLDETDFYNFWEDLRKKLVALTPSREAVRDLLKASQELKDVINFFDEVATETGILCQYLMFLHRFLYEYVCECSNELVESIRNVVNRTLDALNSRKHDRLISRLAKFDDVLLGYSTRSREGKKNPIENMANKFFDGKNGMRLVLLETLGKLHSFEGEIDMICEKLGRKDLQSWNAPFSLSQSLNTVYSVSVFPPSKKRKRRTNGPLKKKRTENSHT
ncbi:hypothetical protein ACH5RR_030094 [Cinchona calisaya]|uniref:Uncharacterized protein n=1 Tax=Cinchona calisaya TaxID=153742 RepID=A0ABD2YYU9_9GENT